LGEAGVSATVWDVRVVKPLDTTMIADAARHRLVLTVEDGIRFGGAGSFMAEAIANCASAGARPPVVVLGTPVAYIPQGKPNRIHAELGLDAAGIAASARDAWQALSAPTQ
jgi:1-deoxy-D-xylulose-5-phosphate synthase